MEFSGQKIPVIYGDSYGYYDHLPFYFIRDGFSISKLFAEQDLQQYWNKYNVGEAIMILPFFLIGHVLSWIFGLEMDGYSVFYQYFVGMSGLVYSIGGIYFLKKILESYFSRKLALLSLIIIIFGTNLFYYSTVSSLMSHSFSFFLVSALIYLTLKWYRCPSYSLTSILGIVAGFIPLVRIINIIFLLIIPLFGIVDVKSLKERMHFFNCHIKKFLLIMGLIVIMFIPQLITWKLTYNSWLVFSYGEEYFDFLNPKIAQTLFSVRRGLFFWSPVLIFSLVGIRATRDKIKQYFIPIILIFFIFIYVNSSWWMWWFGLSFGHRAFIECLPLLILPIASFYNSIKKKWQIIGISIISVFFVIYSLVQMFLYSSGMIPFDEITVYSYMQLFN